jgi:predicted secreted Zn-dependent protease
MPEWTDRASAAPEEQEKWDNAMSGLESHEEEHVQIYVEGAQAAQEAVRGKFTATGTGSTATGAIESAQKNLRSKVSAAFSPPVAEAQRKNEQLDRDTDKGTKPKPN